MENQKLNNMQFCKDCGNPYSRSAIACPKCGCPASDTIYSYVNTSTPLKSRVTYILLGLFLGNLGIHNFYAGYTVKGIIQLLITILIGWWLVVPLFAVGIWVLIEICTVQTDFQGRPFV